MYNRHSNDRNVGNVTSIFHLPMACRKPSHCEAQKDMRTHGCLGFCGTGTVL